MLLARVGAALLACITGAIARLAHAIGSTALPLALTTVRLANYSRTGPVRKPLSCGCQGKRRTVWGNVAFAIGYLAVMLLALIACVVMGCRGDVVAWLMLVVLLCLIPMVAPSLCSMEYARRTCSCPKWHDDNYHGGATA